MSEFSVEELREAEKGNRVAYRRLIDLPSYSYRAGKSLACPECYAPVTRGHRDGRCELCLHDRNLLEVNFLRAPKRREEEEEDE